MWTVVLHIQSSNVRNAWKKHWPLIFPQPAILVGNDYVSYDTNADNFEGCEREVREI